MLHDYVKRILNAKIYDLAIETPLQYAPQLSARFNHDVWIKREDCQRVFSFKLRGAYNKMRRLHADELAKGVIAASAGNHAQGVAIAAQTLAVQATIVMPETTPAIKVNAVKSRGAQVVLWGDTYDQAAEHANKLAKEKGITYIHPYDDVDVIAGQGTVAMEILRQCNQSIDAVFIPVGGGGLAAGMAAYIKALQPHIKIIAVEPEDAACLQAAMAQQTRAILPSVGIFADGVAVKQIGEQPFSVLRDTVDDVLTVSTDEICAAIKDIFEDTRSIAEPAGAVGLAGLKQYAQQHNERQTLVTVESGANMNFDRLRYIAERTDFAEKREAIFSVAIPEEKGSFYRFCQQLGRRNITEFNYRYADDASAYVFVGMQLNSPKDRAELLGALNHLGYTAVDMTDNEMAKVHVRHMVGGKPLYTKPERIYRFEFPERPGALLNFLAQLGQQWNVSMFHYRNHGSAFGRVLVGLHAEESEKSAIEHALSQLHYSFVDETNNVAYQHFL